jgi:Fe-S cluster biogenesis protein NfuA
MVNERELRQRLQRLSALVRELEEAADPNVRSAAKELVQLLMDLHGAAIERMMDGVFQIGESGQRAIDEFGADPLVGSLLVLYGLHPDDLETRVARALQRLAPALHSHGVELGPADIQGSAITIQVTLGAHQCGSTAKTVRALIEEAIYEVAPDITSLVIQGLDGKVASGFVSLEKLLTHNSSLRERPNVSVEHVSGD